MLIFIVILYIEQIKQVTQTRKITNKRLLFSYFKEVTNMLRPSIFTNNVIDNFFNDDFKDFFKNSKSVSNLMNTDIKEYDDRYEMALDLPGFDKEDINIKLKDGSLTIEAKRQESKDEKDEDTGKYIRRERYAGAIRRSFLVGDNVSDEDIYAKFDKGTLEITVPKGKADQKSIEIN